MDLEEAEVDKFYEDLDLLELIAKKNHVLFIIGDWKAKVGSQEIPGLTGKFGLKVQNEAGQELTEFYHKNMLVIANIVFQQYKRWLYTWISPNGHTEITLITFFVDKDGHLYSQQKQDLELTVVRSSLQQKSGLN